ncbi:MAG: tetraacyldisaccharide 4'-kinase [Saprospiraceae bacterium]
MVQNIIAKILLFPFSLLYGLGVSGRDFFYRTGMLKSVKFNIPLISVGNLSVGGAGKTPHIEYLVRLLKDYVNIATLSRGYGRKTQGYLLVQANATAEQVGDEPLQFKRKFPDLTVTVAESRAFAIPRLLSEAPDTQVILLDDAFQHRAVTPGLNILLTEYNHPFTRDWLLPSGRLREWRSSYKRADVIVVTKCPPNLQQSEHTRLLNEIKPFPHQQVFFSYYDYSKPYFIFNPSLIAHLQEDWQVVVICAIARTDYLVQYLQEKVESVTLLEFEDHHFFTADDMQELKRSFDQLQGQKKIILTTEKDATRLELHYNFLKENQLPVFALPVQVQFHFGEGEKFDQLIKDFLLEFQV